MHACHASVLCVCRCVGVHVCICVYMKMFVRSLLNIPLAHSTSCYWRTGATSTSSFSGFSTSQRQTVKLVISFTHNCCYNCNRNWKFIWRLLTQIPLLNSLSLGYLVRSPFLSSVLIFPIPVSPFSNANSSDYPKAWLRTLSHLGSNWYPILLWSSPSAFSSVNQIIALLAVLSLPQRTSYPGQFHFRQFHFLSWAHGVLCVIFSRQLSFRTHFIKRSREVW